MKKLKYITHSNVVVDSNCQDSDEIETITLKDDSDLSGHSAQCTAFKFTIPNGVYNYAGSIKQKINDIRFCGYKTMSDIKYNLKSMNYRTWQQGVTLHLGYLNRVFSIESNSDDNIGLAIPVSLSQTLGIETKTYENSICGKLYSVLFSSKITIINR